MSISYKVDLVIQIRLEFIIESSNVFTNGRAFKLKRWLDKPFLKNARMMDLNTIFKIINVFASTKNNHSGMQYSNKVAGKFLDGRCYGNNDVSIWRIFQD